MEKQESRYPSFESLRFNIQNIPHEVNQKIYEKIVLLDEKLESQSGSLSKIDVSETLKSVTFLYGKWICNFSCPNYCYTKHTYSRKDYSTVYFGEYFRSMRRKADTLKSCLCRSFWKN